MSSCERPSKSSARDLVPSAVSKLYSFSTGTHGSSRRLRASWSLRRVSSFSSLSRASRSACHSSWVPILCSVIDALLLSSLIRIVTVPPGPRVLGVLVAAHRRSVQVLEGPQRRDELPRSRAAERRWRDGDRAGLG